jgi:hypothetical protein
MGMETIGGLQETFVGLAGTRKQFVCGRLRSFRVEVAKPWMWSHGWRNTNDAFASDIFVGIFMAQSLTYCTKILNR